MVSIPYRQSQKSKPRRLFLFRKLRFNSLQVESKANTIFAIRPPSSLFQFLIGRVKSEQNRSSKIHSPPVSIPYRQSQKSNKGKKAANIYAVSIPYRQSQKSFAGMLSGSYEASFNSLQVESKVKYANLTMLCLISFNSLQVESKVRFYVPLMSLVSSFNSLQVESKEQPILSDRQRRYQFQFLIGRVKRSSQFDICLVSPVFQFLIGRVKSVLVRCLSVSSRGFNSLQVESKGQRIRNV